MADLAARFTTAVAASKRRRDEPDSMTLRELDAPHEHVRCGDAAGPRPAVSETVGRAQWTARGDAKGAGSDAAMQA